MSTLNREETPPKFTRIMLKNKCKFSFILLILIFLGASAFSADKPPESSKFIVICPPKCGTHLISRALQLMTNKKPFHARDYYLDDYSGFVRDMSVCEKKKRFIQTHIPVDQRLIKWFKSRKYKVFTILRDPRDVLISSIHWVFSGNDVDHLIDVPEESFSQLSLEEQISELITGERFGFQLIDRLYRRHYDWLELDRNMLYPTTFEELVGPNGGGDELQQKRVIHEIAQHIGMSLSEEKVDKIATELFGNTNTFRSGQIGAWKKDFSDQNKEEFKRYYGEDLIRLGYEQDFDW